MEYNTSDKLAIALACLAGIMAIVLSLVEKTPMTVVSLLALMLALSIYPILHFAKRVGPRVALFVVVAVGTLLFGWSVWPHAHLASANTQTPQSSSEKKPEEKKTEPPKSTNKKTSPKAKTEQRSQGDNSPNVGSITQGPGSIAQIGGQGNQATVNNFGPPQRKLQNADALATRLREIANSSNEAPMVLMLIVAPDKESKTFRDELADAFTKAEWQVSSNDSQNNLAFNGEAFTEGVLCSGESKVMANAVANALEASGIKCERKNAPAPSRQAFPVWLAIGKP